MLFGDFENETTNASETQQETAPMVSNFLGKYLFETRLKFETYVP